ncbi:MAG: PD-(D/E)XK nuclease family protein, partial [Pirellulales bacterium]|nr:PD-(D/E)XK nuclease family protein [Pirellulales bacterium]
MLRDRFEQDGCWDLEQVVCVLPSARAVQRFETLLQWEAEEQGLSIRPPQIITIGSLPELLYRAEAPVALEFEQTLAWAQVLQATDRQSLAPLVPRVPSPEPIGPWLELASTIRRLHADLASNKLEFTEVIEAAQTEAEKQRWRLLGGLLESYLQAINQAGLTDPHWARRQAVARGQCRSENTIVLIGTSDLSGALVDMLRSVDSHILALVAAPARQAFRFDEFGCVETASWLDHPLPLQDDQLCPAGDMADQASAVAEIVADFSERFSADEVTVGVTDESHVGPIELELRGCGVRTYRHLGWTVSQTAVGRLFSLTAAYLQRRSWQTLAALVRHADVHNYLTKHLRAAQSGSDWLIELDQMLANHYPVRVSDPLPRQATKAYPLAVATKDCVESWLSVFETPPQSIAAWSAVVGAWLRGVYDLEEESISHRTAMAVSAVVRMVERFAELNGRLDLQLAGSAALETLAGRMGELRVAESPSAEDVEILGWLDLALDDAPALVVMGMNHPFVPAATTSDPFLPGSLRTRLRMHDNDRRYARDVYAAHLMLTTRSETRFVVGRVAADGSPTPPSRLLAAADKADVARRVRRLLDGTRQAVKVRHRWDEQQSGSLPIPALPKVLSGEEAIDSLSVTAFRDYLVCPYRFFLRHVRKLKPLDDSSNELAANQFGDLVHASLERFGESDDRDETHPAKIEKLLLKHLDQFTFQTYGASVSTAVSVQVAQARR